MENWNIPKNVVLDIVLKSMSSKPSEAILKIFNSICQFKGVDLTFSDRLQLQIKKYMYSLQSYLKKARFSKKGIESFRKKNESKVWPFKVLISEYNISILKTERDTLLLENSTLKKKIGNVKSRFKKLKQKYKSRKLKLNKLRLLQKKISVQILRKANQMKKSPKAFEECSRVWQHKRKNFVER